MRRIVLLEQTQVTPFNEPARDLRVRNMPLWLWQRDLLAPYVTEEREYPDWEFALKAERIAKRQSREEQSKPYLVHRDNLYFNKALIDEFLEQAKAVGGSARLAFKKSDPSIAAHVLPLTHSFEFDTIMIDDELVEIVLADLWYLPGDIETYANAKPAVVDTLSRERGYYHVPPYMATDFGDLVYQLPVRAFALIESWVHLFIVDILFGVFAHGADVEDKINDEWTYKLKIMMTALIEQRRVLRCSELVQVGKNVSIDPSAIIHGPTIIGDNVQIGAGVVIDNCIIGSNVTISQGSQLMLSVVGDGCFLPFRAALFMTTLMENTSVAQNTCLQLCVVGRDSFIGAGTTFTDFNVLPKPLKALSRGKLMDANLLILGGCVGHHCRLTAGLQIYPARTIESDVVLQARDDRHVITHDVRYEESDHFQYEDRVKYARIYPRQDEKVEEPYPM